MKNIYLKGKRCDLSASEHSFTIPAYYYSPEFDLQSGHVWRNSKLVGHPRQQCVWQGLHAKVGCAGPKAAGIVVNCKTWHNTFRYLDNILLLAGVWEQRRTNVEGKRVASLLVRRSCARISVAAGIFSVSSVTLCISLIWFMQMRQRFWRQTGHYWGLPL